MIGRLYLDANVLESRWPSVSGELQILAGLAVLTGTELCIPRSVLIEHEHSTIRRVGEFLDKASRQINEANSRLRGIHAPVVIQRPDEDAMRRAYAVSVRSAERYYRFQIVPSTTLHLEEFVLRAAQHLPPFKNEDRGFRDAVHLQSAIEHLRNSPPPREGDSFFMSADERMAAAETLAVIEAEGVPLKVLTSLRAGIDLVRTVLPPPTDQHYARLGLVWTPRLFERAAENLVPQLVKNLHGVNIGRNVTVVMATPVSMIPEPGTMYVGPPPDGETSYPVSTEARLTIYSLGVKRDGPAAYGGPSWSGNPTLLLTVDASAHAGREFELVDVTFRSARLFAVAWSSQPGVQDIENLPEPVELISL